MFKIEARSQNIKTTSLMHKGMQVHGAPAFQGAIVNAVEHSLSAQSLINAKEEGGTSIFSTRIFSKEHFG